MPGKLAAKLIKFEGDFLESCPRRGANWDIGRPTGGATGTLWNSCCSARRGRGRKYLQPRFHPAHLLGGPGRSKRRRPSRPPVRTQESPGIAKDGKTLFGPVLPRLLAHHGKMALGGKTGGGGGSEGFRRSTGGKATAVKRRAHKPCKETVISQNAGARAPAAAAAAAGAATLAAPAVVNP